MCGAALPEGRPPGVFFRGLRLTFCRSACLLAFKREPERFAPTTVDARPALPPARRTPFVVRIAPPRDEG